MKGAASASTGTDGPTGASATAEVGREEFNSSFTVSSFPSSPSPPSLPSFLPPPSLPSFLPPPSLPPSLPSLPHRVCLKWTRRGIAFVQRMLPPLVSFLMTPEREENTVTVTLTLRRVGGYIDSVDRAATEPSSLQSVIVSYARSRSRWRQSVPRPRWMISRHLS